MYDEKHVAHAVQQKETASQKKSKQLRSKYLSKYVENLQLFEVKCVNVEKSIQHNKVMGGSVTPISSVMSHT